MNCVEKIALNNGWHFLFKDEKKDIKKLAASVPGSIFDDLITHKLVVDPFYGVNEQKVAWVFETDWDYELSIKITKIFLQHEKIIIKFYGLDTFAEISLNGQVIGSTKNMFRTWEFEVKQILTVGDNLLKIHFTSPTRFAREEMERVGAKGKNAFALAGVPYIRKSQYSFGWDWGPQLPDIGIWKPVELIGTDGLMIDSIQCIQEFYYLDENLEKHENLAIEDNIEEVDLTVITNLRIPNSNNSETQNNLSGYTLQVELQDEDNNKLVAMEQINGKEVKTIFEVTEPRLWWPHNLGHPHLYKIMVSITEDGSADAQSGNLTVIDTSSTMIGIRDLSLIRKRDKWGECFYFKLNGIPIFAKGANWIPVDSFVPRGKRLELFERNLTYAKQANMNFIRVWGGGAYEDDLFYSLCDKMGILVWQDFPFACAVYPSEQQFMDNVRQEAVENIIRLRNHPSLALWCGNNEIEQMYIWYSKSMLTPSKRKECKQGYLYLFEKMLPKLISEYDRQRMYWPSSPSNGGLKRGLLKSNSSRTGDSHYWMVWHGGRPFTAYRSFNSRFMSEYGFESFPSMRTISSFCPLDQKDQLNFYSPIMANHQKNMAGNKKIMDYMEKRFSIPKEFEKQVTVSQITQAEAMEYGVEHWRRNRNDYHCMGSLYWQLNDCWPVASWSSLDYYCRWKALQYFAKRFYAQTCASVLESKDNVELWLTNDVRVPQTVTLRWWIFNNEGKELLSNQKQQEIPACKSILCAKLDTKQMNKNKSDMVNHIVFYTLSNSKGEQIGAGCRLFDEPKEFDLKDPNITFSVANENEKACQVTIKSVGLALFVHIDSLDADFIASDNYFPMRPSETRVIQLTSVAIPGVQSSKPLKDSIIVQSLYDLIH
jgi:beta-mannosidase